MKPALYAASQVALFAIVAIALHQVTDRSIAYTTAYGALLITPVILSILTKNIKNVMSYALCAIAWVAGLYIGSDIIKIPGIYLLLTMATWWLFDQKSMSIIAAIIAVYAAAMVKLFGPTADIGEGYKIGENLLWSLMLIAPICVQLAKNDTKTATSVSQQDNRQVA